VRTQVQLTEQQAIRLRRTAAERGVSMAALIREAVDSVVADEDRDARWERAVAAIGCGSSGLTDVGSEHDRYLERAYGGDVR